MIDYDNLERPVVNESHPLLVTFGITLQQIIDVVSCKCYPIADCICRHIIMQIPPSFNYISIVNSNIFQDEKNQLLVSCLWLNLVSTRSLCACSVYQCKLCLETSWQTRTIAVLQHLSPRHIHIYRIACPQNWSKMHQYILRALHTLHILAMR